MTKRETKTVGRLVALAGPVSVFLSLAACRVDDGPTGLSIVQDQDLTTGTGTGTSNNGCVIPGAATTNRRTNGVLDVTVPEVVDNGYLFYPLVENFLGPLTGLSAEGTTGPSEEKNNITVESFHVNLSVAGADGSFTWADGCSAEFDSPVPTGLLAPGATLSEIVSIIRPCNAVPLFNYLDGQYTQGGMPMLEVTATVRAKGHLGGGDIESPPYKFPVDVCYGCLQAGYSDPAAAGFQFPNVPRCSDLTSNPYVGDPCNPAQDELVLCCATGSDAQGQAIAIQCPGVPTGTATATQ